MSNEILTAVWKSAPCQNAELLILLSMADQANDNGVCWPGLTSLMQRSRESRATIYRAISALQEKGIIEELREGDEGHPNIKTKSRVWRIKPVDEWEPLMSEGDELSQFETPKRKRLSQDETRTQSTSIRTKQPSVVGSAERAPYSNTKPVEKWTPRNLAEYFRYEALYAARSLASMNSVKITSYFSSKKKEGFSPVEIKEMIDLFFRDYDRFKRDGYAPWIVFINNSAVLESRAKRIALEKDVEDGNVDFLADLEDPAHPAEYYLQ